MTIGSHTWNPEDFDFDEYHGLEDPIHDVERITKACIYCDVDVPLTRIVSICDVCLQRKRLRRIELEERFRLAFGVTPLGRCIAEQKWSGDK